MSSLRARILDDAGQAFVFVAVALTALVGMAALVVDGGSWYQADRRLQTAADAAALAGAQQLPTDESEARTRAHEYAQKNFAGIPAPEVTFPQPPGTINVSARAETPGIFARIFGIDKVEVHAQAQAQVRAPLSMKHVAPFVVNQDHPLVNGPGCPCFNQETTAPLGNDGLPGNFGVISLDDSNATPGQLESWIRDGYGGVLALGTYNGESGAKFNSDNVKDAMTARIGTELLFPVYDTSSGNGSGAKYNIIGWIAFHVTGFNFHGNGGSITGHFTDFIATDLAGDTTPLDPDKDFGVRVITLTK